MRGYLTSVLIYQIVFGSVELVVDRHANCPAMISRIVSDSPVYGSLTSWQIVHRKLTAVQSRLGLFYQCAAKVSSVLRLFSLDSG